MTKAVLQALQNNGTLYVHTVFTPSGLPLDPSDPDYDSAGVFVKTHREFHLWSRQRCGEHRSQDASCDQLHVTRMNVFKLDNFSVQLSFYMHQGPRRRRASICCLGKRQRTGPLRSWLLMRAHLSG